MKNLKSYIDDSFSFHRDVIKSKNKRKNDPEYKKAVEEITEVQLDFVEGKLYKLINDENPAAIFYYLNNKGKSRGYSHKLNVEKDEDPEKYKPIQIPVVLPPDFKLPEK